MLPRELPYFHRGAQIALENTLDDYLENADMSLLEVLSDLQDKRPVVGEVRGDWERRCAIEGARWVEEAVGVWWVEWMGEDEMIGDEEEDGPGWRR